MTTIEKLIDKYESRLAQVNTLIDSRQMFLAQFLGEEKNPLDSGWMPGETGRRVSDAVVDLALLRREQALLIEITADLRNQQTL